MTFKKFLLFCKYYGLKIWYYIRFRFGIICFYEWYIICFKRPLHVTPYHIFFEDGTYRPRVWKVYADRKWKDKAWKDFYDYYQKLREINLECRWNEGLDGCHGNHPLLRRCPHRSRL